MKKNELSKKGTKYIIADEKVKEREFGNLLLIKDNYPKFVVSMDEYLIPEFALPVITVD